MDTNCKYIKQKYNYTPNDYELEFDFGMIPSNIRWEGPIDLQTSLNRLTPLSKKIHVMMNTSNKKIRNSICLTTKIRWRE